MLGLLSVSRLYQLSFYDSIWARLFSLCCTFLSVCWLDPEWLTSCEVCQSLPERKGVCADRMLLVNVLQGLQERHILDFMPV
jgi:hypothetical protein